MLAERGLRPPRRQGRLRALPGVLGPVGVGARVRSGRTARCPTSSRRIGAHALSCRARRRAAASSTAHFAVRRRGVRRGAGALRGDDRDARDDDAGDAARRRRWSTARSSARCGCTRSTSRAVEGRPARGAARPRDAPARRDARALRGARPAGALGGRRMVAQVQVPERALLRAPRLGPDGDAGAVPRRHAPADGDRRCGPRPVSGVPARSHTVRLRPPRRAAARRVSSKRAARRAREPAREERARTARVGVLRPARRAGSRSSGTSAASARAATPVGPRERVDVERRAAAGALEHLQQRAGDAGHRDVARRVAEPALGDLDERLAVVAQPLGRRGRAAS